MRRQARNGQRGGACPSLTRAKVGRLAPASSERHLLQGSPRTCLAVFFCDVETLNRPGANRAEDEILPALESMYRRKILRHDDGSAHEALQPSAPPWKARFRMQVSILRFCEWCGLSATSQPGSGPYLPQSSATARFQFGRVLPVRGTRSRAPGHLRSLRTKICRASTTSTRRSVISRDIIGSKYVLVRQARDFSTTFAPSTLAAL